MCPTALQTSGVLKRDRRHADIAHPRMATGSTSPQLTLEDNGQRRQSGSHTRIFDVKTGNVKYLGYVLGASPEHIKSQLNKTRAAGCGAHRELLGGSAWTEAQPGHVGVGCVCPPLRRVAFRGLATGVGVAVCCFRVISGPSPRGPARIGGAPRTLPWQGGAR
jgi:hypothetical protein